MTQNPKNRFQVITADGLESYLCRHTKAAAFAAAETLPGDSGQVIVVDSMARRGQPQIWTLMPNHVWRLTKYRDYCGEPNGR